MGLLSRTSKSVRPAAVRAPRVRLSPEEMKETNRMKGREPIIAIAVGVYGAIAFPVLSAVDKVSKHKTGPLFFAAGFAVGLTFIAWRFRNRMVVEFYAARARSGKRFVYLPRTGWPAEGPEWLVRHDFVEYEPSPAATVDERGRRYDLVQVYRYARLSGWNWYVYRRR